jgi:hypothetical protein
MKNEELKITKTASPNTQHLTPSIQLEVEREAEECFLEAIAIAQRQQAKSLELRAVMSLVRLRQHQEHATRTTQHGQHPTQHDIRIKLNEAHRMLSEVYNWFTEGFDTLDLQEAKALLDKLSH